MSESTAIPTTSEQVLQRQLDQYRELNDRKRALGVLNHDHVLGGDDVCHYCAYGLEDRCEQQHLLATKN